MIDDQSQVQHDMEQLVKRSADISKRIDSALHRANRMDEPIRIVAVTKYVDIDTVEKLTKVGYTDFGENRWQVAKSKVEAYRTSIWHFIGPLQRNKVRFVVPHFSFIHSVDRPELADEISREALNYGVRPNVLLQVNVSDEPQKSGIDPENAFSLVEHCAMLPGLRVLGFMAIGRNTEHAVESRADFRRLVLLRNDIQQKTGLILPELSMGMSKDFDIAVEEGATIVRIGRYLVNFDQEL